MSATGYAAPMIALLASLAAAGCHPQPLTLRQAEQLVLAAPNIRASVSERGAKPFFEYVERISGGWSFGINSATPCAIVNPCSSLLGHYSVGRDGDVIDLDRGEEGVGVSSPAMARLLRRFRRSHC
jgi:hypothetical protein